MSNLVCMFFLVKSTRSTSLRIWSSCRCSLSRRSVLAGLDGRLVSVSVQGNFISQTSLSMYWRTLGRSQRRNPFTKSRLMEGSWNHIQILLACRFRKKPLWSKVWSKRTTKVQLLSTWMYSKFYYFLFSAEHNNWLKYRNWLPLRKFRGFPIHKKMLH